MTCRIGADNRLKRLLRLDRLPIHALKAPKTATMLGKIYRQKTFAYPGSCSNFRKKLGIVCQQVQRVGHLEAYQPVLF